MPWQIISEHSGFFGAVLGAVAGGAGAWASISQWVSQLRENDRRQDALLEAHAKELEQIKITRRELVFRNDCDKEQEDCKKALCRKLEDLSQLLRDSMTQTIENAKGIATIQEHLRGLEKRYDNDQRRIEREHQRHEAVL